MADFDPRNRGSLFRNTRKETDTHPDHTGSINIEGVEYWLSAWVRESKAGQKFFSLSVRPKQATTEHDATRKLYKAPADGGFEDDSDIPF